MQHVVYIFPNRDLVRTCERRYLGSYVHTISKDVDRGASVMAVLHNDIFTLVHSYLDVQLWIVILVKNWIDTVLYYRKHRLGALYCSIACKQLVIHSRKERNDGISNVFEHISFVVVNNL